VLALDEHRILMAEVPVLVRRNRDDVHHVFISVLPAHADLSNEADLQVPIMEHAVIVTLVATDELVELALVVLEAANDLAAFSIFALIDSENAVIGQDESDALRDFCYLCHLYRPLFK